MRKIVVFFLVAMSLAWSVTAFGQVSSQTLAQMISREIMDGSRDSWGTEIFQYADVKVPKVEKGVFALPFKSDQKNDRFYFDVKGNFDFSQSSTFYIDYKLDNPRAVSGITLYFHSGNGWFTMSGKILTRSFSDGKTVQFNMGSAHVEDKPGRLDKVDTIRIGFWRGEQVDSSVTLGSFLATCSTVTVLVPDGDSSKETSRIASSFGTFAASAGLSLRSIQPKELTAERLKQIPALIIPIQPKLKPEEIDLLCDYAKNGGFILACYTLPAKLMKTLGFGPGEYVGVDQIRGNLGEVRFLPTFQRDLGPLCPRSFKQGSHNICVAKPLTKIDDEFLARPENKPQIVGWWFDRNGKKTPWPAMLASGRGIYFSHIIASDDPISKQAFLAAVVGKRDRTVYADILRTKWHNAFEIGVAPGTDIQLSRQQAATDVADKLVKKGFDVDQILKVFAGLPGSLFSSKDSAKMTAEANKIFLVLDEIGKERSNEYCAKIKPLKKESRFWWEHSGLGAYPGDWDRTMKELSAAGFNGVIANMLCGGSACYKSELLPLDPKVNQYGDQIEQAVAAGKKYGVEIHVWKVNFRCARTTPEFKKKIFEEGRAQKSFSGASDDVWLCPSHPENQKLEVATMIEVATKYKVDGIHFDYIRYPDGSHCYCDGCKERFGKWLKAKTGKTLENWPGDTRKPEIAEHFTQWRCDQITAVVRETRRQLDALHSPVFLSAAVFSGYPGCRASVGQDWVSWCHAGYLDFVCPMDYTDSAESFESLVANQMNYVKGTTLVYPGIGVTVPRRLRPDEACVQINVTRQHKAGGFVFFDLNNSMAGAYLPLFDSIPMKAKPATSHKDLKK
ncbi:MAG: family 10 glycosylhydrolase [Thermoguttaceae bacterium]|nr:family 10 glycosylhydrolase [Thermoguttaceae bacterium]